MYRARIKSSGQEVLAVQIGDKPAWYTDKHPLICASCSAGVHGRGQYVKRSGASYRAHFALNPSTTHDATCPLNPVEFITSVARQAQGLAHAEDGVLRLTLPGGVEDLAPPPGPPDTEPEQEVTAHRTDTVAPPLPPLLNCAAKIARFLQFHAFDDQVVRRFRVQPPGRTGTIPWGRFCYGPTAAAYGELIQRLDPDSPGRTPGHPVAVHGTVQRIHHDRAGRPFVFLADHTDLDGREFEVVLRSMHPTLIEPLTVGTHVLAVGDWAVFPGGRVPQLRLFAEAAWQIAYWHTDQESGTATRPASPPAVTARQRTTERPARPAQRTSRSTKTGRRPTTPPRRPAPAPPPLQAPAPRAEARDSPPPPAAPPDPERKTPTTESDESPADASAKQPALPPRPPHPPKPTTPPPLPASRRRKGLPAWLGRRKHRRR